MLRVAVIGCRGIGGYHAQGVAAAGDAAELVAGCDLSEELLTEFRDQWKDRFPNLSTYTDYQEMLNVSRPDIVTVATGDHQHAFAVIAAAEAGAKGIFCEKPLATNLADADRMLEAVDQHGALLSIDHTRRWMPVWRHAREQVIDAGVIGDVVTIIGAFGGPRAMLFRNGTHILDTICWFADSDPEWVMADLEEGYQDYTEYRGDGGHLPETEPAAQGYIHFANGVRAFYSGGPKNTAAGDVKFTVEGTLGTMLVSESSVIVEKDGETSRIDLPNPMAKAIPVALCDLIDVVANGGTPRSTGGDGMRVVEILIGFLESQRQGNNRVQLPLPRGR